jgi:hypothetical protein
MRQVRLGEVHELDPHLATAALVAGRPGDATAERERAPEARERERERELGAGEKARSGDAHAALAQVGGVDPVLGERGGGREEDPLGKPDTGTPTPAIKGRSFHVTRVRKCRCEVKFCWWPSSD